MIKIPRFPVLLDLGDGRELIPCRDGHQADMFLSLWRAWHSVSANEPAQPPADASVHAQGQMAR